VKWFKGDNLTTSQAIQLSFLRIGGISNAMITPYISAQYGI
jgi:hypothetical protein